MATPFNEPGLVDTDVRICFGIAWFDSESNAEAFSAKVMADDHRYNGGWYDGRRCCRDDSWDREQDGVKHYAVTF